MAIKIIPPRDVKVTQEEFHQYQREVNQEIDDGYYIGTNPPSLEEYIRFKQNLQKPY